MRFFMTLLTLLSMSQYSLGSEVWVTFSQLSTKGKLDALAEERREQIKEADFISSFDAMISHPVSEEALNAVLKTENQAQEEVLNGHFYKAVKLYKLLQLKLENIPNVSGIEKITFSTFIQLAELHDILNDGDGFSYWKQAHAWASNRLSAGPEFSPKAVAKFNALKLSPAHGTLEIICPLEAAVFVDGKNVLAGERHFRKSLEPGYHHVDVLAPGSEWMSKSIYIKNKEARDLTFRPEPVVEGTCDDPHFTGNALPPKTKLLVNFGTCDRIYFEKSWFNVAGRKLESLAPGPSAPTIAAELAATPEEKSWASKTIHSNWFWIGLGVVAAGAVALSVQNQNQPAVIIPTNSIK